jgi:hypothetical protein
MSGGFVVFGIPVFDLAFSKSRKLFAFIPYRNIFCEMFSSLFITKLFESRRNVFAFCPLERRNEMNFAFSESKYINQKKPCALRGKKPQGTQRKRQRTQMMKKIEKKHK